MLPESLELLALVAVPLLLEFAVVVAAVGAAAAAGGVALEAVVFAGGVDALEGVASGGQLCIARLAPSSRGAISNDARSTSSKPLRASSATMLKNIP